MVMMQLSMKIADFIHEVLGDSVQEICIRGTERYAGRLISHGDYLKKGSG